MGAEFGDDLRMGAAQCLHGYFTGLKTLYLWQTWGYIAMVKCLLSYKIMHTGLSPFED